MVPSNYWSTARTKLRSVTTIDFGIHHKQKKLVGGGAVELQVLAIGCFSRGRTSRSHVEEAQKQQTRPAMKTTMAVRKHGKKAIRRAPNFSPAK